jgi:hypothetical protein
MAALVARRICIEQLIGSEKKRIKDPTAELRRVGFIITD